MQQAHQTIQIDSKRISGEVQGATQLADPLHVVSSSSIKNDLKSSPSIAFKSEGISSKSRINFIHEKFVEKDETIKEQIQIIEKLKQELYREKMERAQELMKRNNLSPNIESISEASLSPTAFTKARVTGVLKKVESPQSLQTEFKPTISVESAKSYSKTEAVGKDQNYFRDSRYREEVKLNQDSVYTCQLESSYQYIKQKYEQLYDNFRRLHFQHSRVTSETRLLNKRVSELQQRCKQFDSLQSSLRNIIRSRDQQINYLSSQNSKLHPDSQASSSPASQSSELNMIGVLNRKIQHLKRELHQKQNQNLRLRVDKETMQESIRQKNAQIQQLKGVSSKNRWWRSGSRITCASTYARAKDPYIKVETQAQVPNAYAKKPKGKTRKPQKQILHRSALTRQLCSSNHNPSQKTLDLRDSRETVIKNISGVHSRHRSPSSIIKQPIRDQRSPTIINNIKY